MTHKTIFIAHPKEIEQDEIDGLVALVGASTLVTPESIVVPARESFLDYEKKHGKPVNWKRWFDHITGMQGGFSRDAVFDAFVVGPSSIVGKATQDIANTALRRGRALYRVTPEQQIVKANKVTCLDPHNYAHGWVVS
jgi:hypothetical protein